ncbi:DUF6519 domain-containing protein [Catellatospora vulcania]|uniref:DUF6519 domain-containing protein n=1 Tax=Catellatospora vulcania TaxID=1460450 RepID=UPI0012D38614|nr:DUF6519 domain-containing protein [Catellatospora vulcania]
MGADLSRVRFDPRNDYSGVGFEQGRLVVDAELNEEHAITDRRGRAQVADLAPTPTIVSRLTPKAFEISVSGGAISIGAGRMYVDGVLVENHGDTPAFDPVLAEPNGTGTTAYDKQPYWPTPDKLPTSGTHLAYLQVWERERTHLNTPDLIESAIGVDTSIRTQIAWQVRLLAVGADASCGSDIPKWNELTAPSSARLTTGTVDVDAADDPCEIPPGKGYRGPENQLYRVELYSPTQFLWSRDNATVASAATFVTATELRLDTLGRDDVLRIKDNDWVEITDDRRELNHLPGELRKVTVDSATSTITFSGALPGDLAPSTHHLRVRKWDSPLLTIPADGSAVTLEHGITVAFSFTGAGKPRPGDHWVFAARATAPTPEESLEQLTAAPPLGIHHHFARLALVKMPGSIQSDCRPDWPVATGESCECEICVTPQSHADGSMTVQDAIEKIRQRGGGTVRLCPGDYQLEEPIRLHEARSLRLVGAGADSRLLARDTGIDVSYCQDVVLSDFSVTGQGEQPAVTLTGANTLIRLEHLWLVQRQGTGLGLTGLNRFVSVTGCLFQSATGIEALTTAEGKESGLLTYCLSIRDNLFGTDQRGIDFAASAERVIQHDGLVAITGNTFSDCADRAISATGLILQDAAELDGDLVITGNIMEVRGGGILTGSRARICDNTVISTDRGTGCPGIEAETGPPDTLDGVLHVLANKVSGFGDAGIVVVAPLRSAIVKQNVVQGCAAGILVQSTAGSVGGHVAVDNNQVLDLHPVEEGGRLLAAQPTAAQATAARRRTATAGVEADEQTIVLGPPVGGAPSAAHDPAASGASAGRAAGLFSRAGATIGIAVVGAADGAVVGNTVDGLAADEADAGRGRHVYGIMAATNREVRISGNTVNRVGSPNAAVGNAYGIICGGWQDTALVADNIVLSGGPAPVARPGWTALAMVNGVSQRAGGVRAMDTTAGRVSFAGSFAYLQEDVPGHAELTGNTLHGGADDVAVTVQTPGDVLMSGNRCAQPGGAEQAVVRLAGATAAVHGNRVQGGYPSMTIMVGKDASGEAAAAAVVGNITTGGIQVDGSPLQAPWAALNPIA